MELFLCTSTAIFSCNPATLPDMLDLQFHFLVSIRSICANESHCIVLVRVKKALVLSDRKVYHRGERRLAKYAPNIQYQY